MNIIAKVKRETKRIVKQGRNLFWRINPFRRKFPLSLKEMEYFKTKYDLPYHLDCLVDLFNITDLRDKSVLEIGGSNLPKELIFNKFHATQWNCIEYMNWWEECRSEESPLVKGQTLKEIDDIRTKADLDKFSKKTEAGIPVVPLEKANDFLLSQKHIVFDGLASHMPDIFNNRFDSVVSICSFEHINDLPQTLERIYQVLKPGGVLYTNFGPIWSCHVGNHFWFNKEFSFPHFEKLGIEPYVHFLYSPEEFKSRYRDKFDTETVEKLTQQIYFSDTINRMFYDDYIRCFAQSPFTEFRIKSYSNKEKRFLPFLHAVEKKFPDKSHFDVFTIVFYAKKE